MTKFLLTLKESLEKLLWWLITTFERIYDTTRIRERYRTFLSYVLLFVVIAAVVGLLLGLPLYFMVNSESYQKEMTHKYKSDECECIHHKKQI